MEQIVGHDPSSARSDIERSFADAVERSALEQYPFDHIYIENVLDEESYRSLLSALPERRFYHQLRHPDAMRIDGSSTRLRMYLYPELLRNLPAEQQRVWMPIAQVLCSDKLQDAFRRKFRTALEQRFGKSAERIGLFPVPILLRDQPGYRIGIHSDLPTKAITVQFYLPRDASQRHLGTIFHEGDKGELAERTAQMPFMPATGYAFPVSLTKSWHSAANATDADAERISMMVTYYVADGFVRRLYWRLRRAALSLGIHPKG